MVFPILKDEYKCQRGVFPNCPQIKYLILGKEESKTQAPTEGRLCEDTVRSPCTSQGDTTEGPSVGVCVLLSFSYKDPWPYWIRAQPSDLILT